MVWSKKCSFFQHRKTRRKICGITLQSEKAIAQTERRNDDGLQNTGDYIHQLGSSQGKPLLKRLWSNDDEKVSFGVECVVIKHRITWINRRAFQC